MSERQDVKRREFACLCDFCHANAPTLRYSIPVGTCLDLVSPPSDGVSCFSDGNLGMCAGCKLVLDSGLDVARRLAERLIDLNPKLGLGVPKDLRDLRRRAVRRLNERLLPLLSNPVPFFAGEKPMDLKGVIWDADKPAPPEVREAIS